MLGEEGMVYVDWLIDYGWRMYGKKVKSCHMFSGDNDQVELDKFAKKIGLKKGWLQKSRDGLYHYDLVESKRVLAIDKGAKEVSKKEFLRICRKIRRKK